MSASWCLSSSSSSLMSTSRCLSSSSLMSTSQCLWSSSSFSFHTASVLWRRTNPSGRQKKTGWPTRWTSDDDFVFWMLKSNDSYCFVLFLARLGDDVAILILRLRLLSSLLLALFTKTLDGPPDFNFAVDFVAIFFIWMGVKTSWNFPLSWTNGRLSGWADEFTDFQY